MKTQKTRRPRWPVDHQMRSKMPSRGSPERPNGPPNRPLGPPKPSQDSPGGTLCQSFRIFFHFGSPLASILGAPGSIFGGPGPILGAPGSILRVARYQFCMYFSISTRHQVFRLLFDFVNGLASITKSRRTEAYVKRVQ